MRVTNTEELDDFMFVHADSRVSILRWLTRVRGASWRNPNEMAREMTNYDRVGGGRYVFDINNNNYRLVAKIEYANQWVEVRFIGTHRDYDRIDARTV